MTIKTSKSGIFTVECPVYIFIILLIIILFIGFMFGGMYVYGNDYNDLKEQNELLIKPLADEFCKNKQHDSFEECEYNCNLFTYYREACMSLVCRESEYYGLFDSSKYYTSAIIYHNQTFNCVIYNKKYCYYDGMSMFVTDNELEVTFQDVNTKNDFISIDCPPEVLKQYNINKQISKPYKFEVLY